MPDLRETFERDGFIRIDGAFSREIAEAGRNILWRETGCDPNDPATWTKPVIRLGGYADPPFDAAVNAPVLREAYDALTGAGGWQPRNSLGTFPIRFPHPDDSADTGWHVDASFSGPEGDWRVNVHSKGRALLMLFLFSDVGEDDAPTRIRVGSHRDMPRVLAPFGEAGASVFELSYDCSAHRPEALAAGDAGTVYLCHPFLVHAAQLNLRGKSPRFLAQPPLLPSGERPLEDSLVAKIIRNSP